MPKLRLLNAGPDIEGHGGEVFACAFTPDGQYVLSGGWDGHLRFWEAASGQPVAGFRASPKALSACGVAPGGKYWVSGSLDGMLTFWDPQTQDPVRKFLAHTRPVSAVLFAKDDRTLVTASWDGSLGLWNLEQERDPKVLTGHADIVSGVAFTTDERRLLSWSYDGTLRLWELAPPEPAVALRGHSDRVTAAAVAPDGRWFASAGRDGTVKLWDVQAGRAAASVQLPDEVRGCFFTGDGESLLTVDLHGQLAVHRLPELTEVEVAATRLEVFCAVLDASGQRLALGCGDGRVHFVAVDGIDQTALFVTPTQTTVRTATALQRLFGGHTVKQAYRCTCPICRRSFDLPKAAPGQPAPCPHCRQRLRLSAVTRVEEEEEPATAGRHH